SSRWFDARGQLGGPIMVLDFQDCLASARSLAWTSPRRRVALTLWNLAPPAVVRVARAVANRGGFAPRAARDSAQPDLPCSCGIAPDAMGRTGEGIRALARLSARRYVLRDRVEGHGTAECSGHPAFPVGTEAGSIFCGRSIAGVRPCA